MCVGYKRIFCKFKESLAFSVILNLKNIYIFSGSMPPHIFQIHRIQTTSKNTLLFSFIYLFILLFSFKMLQKNQLN